MSSEVLMWGLLIALLLAVALLALLVVSLLRSYAQITRVLHDAGIRLEDARSGTSSPGVSPTIESTHSGQKAHAVAGETLEGGSKAISLEAGSGSLLLAFLSSGCGSCQAFWRTLRSEEGRLPGLDAPVIVVTKSPSREEPGKLTELAGDGVEVIMSDETWNAYDVPVTPHFALVDRATGTIIGEGSSADPSSLAQLMARAASDSKNLTRRELLTKGRGAG